MTNYRHDDRCFPFFDVDFGDDDPRAALLDAPRLLKGQRPVAHPAFSKVRRELLTSVRGSPLTLLCGVTGAGKTHSVVTLLQRLDRFVGDSDDIPGVYVAAPATQRGPFRWKVLWERVLTALEDPLPGAKIDPIGTLAALQGTAGELRPRWTEDRYFQAVVSAARARGLRVLCIDEAIALAKSETGVTLTQQLRVLAELADLDLFRIVLVSTFDILPHIRRVGVLDRRLATIVFERYPEEFVNDTDRVLDTSSPSFGAFVRAAASFIDRLPEESRIAFTEEQFVKLYRGSLGCVGLLHDWIVRAIAVSLQTPGVELRWEHFEKKPLSVGVRANLIFEARAGDEQLMLLRDRRLDLTEDELLEIAHKQAKSDAVLMRRKAAKGMPGPRPGGRGAKRRPGKPASRRVPLA